MAIDHIVDQISTVLGLLIYHFFDLITNVWLPESSLLKAIIFSLFASTHQPARRSRHKRFIVGTSR